MKYYSQYRSHDLFELQESLSGLSKSNRWGKLADHLPWDRTVVSLKVCNSSFLSLYFHCYFILFFPVFELIYSPFICRLCFLHRHSCQEEDDGLL